MRVRIGAVVLDAADLEQESRFWAGLLEGSVTPSAGWHLVRPAAAGPVIGVQLSPRHVPPEWPCGPPQQLHLDLEVDDIGAAHERAVALGARVLRPAAGPDVAAPLGFQVYSDPAGHPFCLCWGQDY